MRPTIVIDANPIISALIGGFSKEIIFDHHFNFITTAFTIKEVIKFIPYISKKSGVSEDFIKMLLDLLPLRIYALNEYQAMVHQAESLITDKSDVHILALALAKNSPLWSNDRHFENIKEIKLIKTKDFV